MFPCVVLGACGDVCLNATARLSYVLAAQQCVISSAQIKQQTRSLCLCVYVSCEGCVGVFFVVCFLVMLCHCVGGSSCVL
jgi:hypothetical protein